mmetsp:Transcript_104379/g.164716  ORF Transcript_104379/g.164716 Transcript_104379/m.164716 type:complete len:686 (-) Transcript_104379:325-2382(-)
MPVNPELVVSLSPVNPQNPEEEELTRIDWGEEQLSQEDGEALANDPDWTPGCWCTSYCRYHNFLVRTARDVATERQTNQTQSERAAGQQEVTIASSMRLLRREVFSLCPLRYLIVGIFFSITLTILSFLVPYVQGRVVDVAVDSHNKHKAGQDVDIANVLLPYLLWFGGFTLAGYLCEIIVGILFAICGHTTVTRLRIKLFKNLTIQEIAFYDAHVSGELSSRLINDSASLSSLTQFTTQTLLGAFVKFAGSLVAMYTTHPFLALIATVITPLNTVLVRATGKTVGHYGVVQNHAMAKANATAIEVLGSIRTVHSNCGEEHEYNVFMQKLNYYLRVIKATVYLETVLRFTSYGLSRARNIVVLAVAMHQVIVGELSIGSYTAFAQYVTLYQDGFQNLADIWINFRQTITSTGKFVQLLLRETQIPLEGGRTLETCTGAITLENVFFEYKARPDQRVLKGVSLNVVPGTSVALVGESGAGKSTVGRLLQRYYDPTEGSIKIDGVDFKELNLRWLRSQIGNVEQEPVLFDRPIYENIAYGSARGAALEDIQEAAKMANAHDFIKELQNGYKTDPGERAARISGGQKQRVAIARAIIRNPKVLLLDEATSALDSENEHIVQQALDNLMVGKTTFIIAHRLSTIVHATKIVVLDKGVVIEQGSHDELVADDSSKYSSFMKHQLVKPLLE